MRAYINLSFDLESGEAEITNGSCDVLQDLIDNNPLLAADCLKDVIFELERYYDDALLKMRTPVKK